MTDAGVEIDIQHLQTWIGHEEISQGLVGGDLVARFSATLDHPAPDLRQGEVAPQLIHFCLGQAPVRTSGLSEDGHPQRGGFLPPVPLPRRMWAAGDLRFHRDLRIGDTVRRVSRVADVSLKLGKSGALCFVQVEHALDVDGERAIEEKQTIVYRGMSDAASSKQPASADLGQHRREMKASPALLFRYSAVTFNSHRIHYDRRHATETEGYPGLVVHGPLQATLLLHFATELGGRRPATFSFRSLSPLFERDRMALHASEDKDGLKLWTAAENGPIAMDARVEWQ